MGVHVRVVILAAVGLFAVGAAEAASREVKYAPPPAWIIPPPTVTAAPAAPGAPTRVDYVDIQTRVGPDADEIYTAYRIKLLSPQGLPLGNISGAWNPSSDDFTIHHLRIVRETETVDVLKATKFQIVQRENGLELAVLSGQLTANIQTPGLEVGDTLEFAATVRRRDPNLGGRTNGFIQLPVQGQLGTYRARLVWADGKSVGWRASPGLEPASPVAGRGQQELVYELRDPKAAVLSQGAPPRANRRRVLHWTSFGAWSEVSDVLLPLFDKAAALPKDSPVRAEAARIAREVEDPAGRALAALRLVQDRIRYVYVGLDGGNYRPATVDETWSRRFGDCKGKTVLLLALLRELGVPAEAVLVNLQGGDGTDELLATPGAFNHVLVRTTIDGKAYWLDGTRHGDRSLASLPAPPFRWALPLRPRTAELEAVPAEAPDAPQTIVVLDHDATAGFDARAKTRARQVVRGDQAWQMQAQLTALSPEDAERALKALWRSEVAGSEPATVAWRYDELQKLLLLSMVGDSKLDWEGAESEGRSLDIPGAGFYAPDELKRPAEQDQSAPWLVDNFPRYRCWAATIRLPPAKGKWRWSFRARHVNQTLGGVYYFRTSALDSDVMRTVMSRRTLQPEISAAEAVAVNAQRDAFDNKISRVFQITAAIPNTRPSSLAALDSFDWERSASACGPGPQQPTRDAAD